MSLLDALARWFRRPPKAETCILRMLAAAHEPMYGLDMVNQSNGMLKRGTVYVWLGRLQERGLVDSTSPDLYGRRRYVITREGRSFDIQHLQGSKDG